MITVEVDRVINRPIKEVFTFMTDIEQLPRYATGVIEAHWLPPGWIGIGSKFKVVSRLLVTSQNEVQFEVTDVRPNKTFSFKTISGNIPISSTISFNEVPQGTQVMIRAESEEPKGVLRFAAPMFVRKVSDQLETELDNAKRLLESSH